MSSQCVSGDFLKFVPGLFADASSSKENAPSAIGVGMTQISPPPNSLLNHELAVAGGGLADNGPAPTF